MLRFSAFLTALALLGACGDDDVDPPPRDASVRRDTGVEPDGGEDPDGGTDPDAGDPGDGGLITPGECSTDEGDLFPLFADARRRDRRVAVAGGEGGFVAAWVHNGGVFDGLFLRWVPSTGEIGEQQQVTDDFASQRAPALARRDGGFVLGWHDNAGESGFEVRTRLLDASGSPTAESLEITDGGRTVAHDNVALARTSTGVVAAFVEDDTMGSRILQSVALDASGAAAGTPAEVGPSPVLLPAMSSFGDGAALVWANLTPGDDPDTVQLRPLGASGAPTAAAIQVDEGGDAAGTTAVAGTPDGLLGVVFDVDVGGGGSRQEVRFRQLDETGTPVGVEAVITDLDTGRDPGIGAFAGGFVIAYRGLETEGLDGPTIRLAFTNIRGQVVETFDLDPTTATGGPVTVAVSLDGTAILVGWASDSEDGTDTFVRRIRCDG